MEERIEGFAVDLHCIRRWPQLLLQERARKHPSTCAELHLESGFALVDGCAVALDPAATPMVMRALREAGDERGVRLRALRRTQEGEMVSQMVEIAIPREQVESSNIQSIGWMDRILEIEFKSGIYQFLDVPRQIFEEMMQADSYGRYFNNHVKNKFQSRKV